MVRALLLACTILSLVFLVLGEVFKGDGNNDPRLYFGRSTLIFHAHDEIVLVGPHHPPEPINYGPVRLGGIGVFLGSFILLSYIVWRDHRRKSASIGPTSIQ
jgi:hypothetical protein